MPSAPRPSPPPAPARDIRRNSQITKMTGSSRISQYRIVLPRPELGAAALTVFTPSALSCWLNAGEGWPGITVVYDEPLVSVPVTVVFEPLAPLPKSTVLILWALASEMNCEQVRLTGVLILMPGRTMYSITTAMSAIGHSP